MARKPKWESSPAEPPSAPAEPPRGPELDLPPIGRAQRFVDAIISLVLTVNSYSRLRLPGIVIPRDHPELLKVAEELEARFMELEIIAQQRTGKRGAQSTKAVTVRTAFFQACRDEGLADELTLRLFDRFQILLGKVSAEAQRVRRSRTKKSVA